MQTKQTGPSVWKGLQQLAFLGLLSLGTYGAYGFDDYTMDDDDFIHSDQLDIDGDFTRKRDIAKPRKSLEQRTNDLVDKKIEDVRIKHERALQKDLKGIFTGDVTDSAGNQQAAPKSEVIIHQPQSSSQRFSVSPVAGVGMVKADNLDIETSMNLGLRFDAMLNHRFAMGLNFLYSKAEIKQFNFGYANAPVIPSNNFGNPYTPYGGGYGYPYNSGFNNGFNNGGYVNNVDYSRLTMELTGKFFILNDDTVRPYIGAGLGITRAKLAFAEEDGQRGFLVTNYGFEEEYSKVLTSGAVEFGSDFIFTESFGVNVNFRWARTFGGSDNNQEFNFLQSNARRSLEDLGNRLEDANFWSLNAGLVIRF